MKENMDHLNKCKKKATFKPPYKTSDSKSVENVKKETKGVSKKNGPIKRKSTSEKLKMEKKIKLSDEAASAGLGTSGLNKHKGGPICLEDSFSDSDLTDDDDSDICCVCNKRSPAEIHKLAGIVFVKWAQCDNVDCRHWTHLQFCSHVRVIQRGDVFFCPHCLEQ